jgi:hypothetical protein
MVAEAGPLNEIVCVRGESFAISGPDGNITPGGDHGVFVRDTRFLNRFEILVGGQRPVHLSGASMGGHRAVFHTYLPVSDDATVDPVVMITRRRVVDGGVREEVAVTNSGKDPAELDVTVRVGADFAYIFDVKHGLVLDQMPAEPEGKTIAFHRAGGEERTVVTAEGAAASDNRLTTELTVPPGGTAAMVVEVPRSIPKMLLPVMN